jgi:glycosyltransferase involved in cell wall biosynthesis
MSINQGPFKEIISNNKDGLVVQSFESIQVYDFIIKLFEDSEFESELSNNAVQNSVSFSWEHTSKALNKIYTDIII